METLRAQLLEVLRDAHPRALSFEEILQRLHAEGVPPEKQNPIRGRLSDLHNEGIVEKADRGAYQLTRIQHQPTLLELELAELSRRVLKPEALQAAVIWDATPYLEMTEDGAPGARVVFEHPDAALLKDVIETQWHHEPPPFVWVTNSRGPLGRLLWQPDGPAPSKIHYGVILVANERLGGTALSQQGYRVPFRERILLEFLGMDVDPDLASPIIRQLLRAGIDVRRAWGAANGLRNLPDLVALLASAYKRLPANNRVAFRGRLAPAAAALLEKA